MSGSEKAAAVRRLDLRGLDPPEPMQRALEAAETLGPGETVEVITDREPLLLYRELARRNHPYSTGTARDAFSTTIRRGGAQGERP